MALIVALVLAVALVLVARQVLRVAARPDWPPPPGAVTAAGALQATRDFTSLPRAGPRDAALPFAWSTAATIDPWPDGPAFYPRILADVEAARSSVHILMFGWKDGEVGRRMAAALERRMADGVAVRVLVDALGSRPHGASRELFTRLARGGAQIVVNDVLPPVRTGLFPDRRRSPRRTEIGRADHRKLYVVDGETMWTGGAGIEDHFADGRFHDVMVRVTGDVVRQAQAAFLTSFHAHGGPLPSDLGRLFPAPLEPGAIPVAIAQVMPGGHTAASQAIAAQIDLALRRLDLINPYFTDPEMVDRILAAARRGVRVRIVAAQRSNSALAAGAARHRYAELAAAGVEIWEYPGAVVHAKVVVADDVVSFGTVNLDAWALYRNCELVVVARSTEAADRFEERLFEPDIARSRVGVAPTGARRLTCRACAWLTYFL